VRHRIRLCVVQTSVDVELPETSIVELQTNSGAEAI